MTDSADHVSGKTGLTLTITASKAAGAFASITPTATERAYGWYALALTADHTDTLGDLALHVTAPGADPTDKLFNVVAGSLDADVSTLPAAVWKIPQEDVMTAGTTGESLGICSSTPDPWSVDLSTYGASTAGNRIYANLDAAVGSRLPTSSYVAPSNSAIAGIKLVTDRLTGMMEVRVDPATDYRWKQTALELVIGLFPSNSASLAIDGSGRMTVGGFATGLMPANFEDLVIAAGTGVLDVNVVEVNGSAAAPGDPTKIAAAVWAETEGVSVASVAEALGEILVDDGGGSYEFTAGALANAPASGGGAIALDLTQALPASPIAGTVGEALKFADTRLDAAISTRAASSTALSSATWTNAKAAFVDAAISTRAPASTALTNVTWTDAKAAFVDASVAGASAGAASAVWRDATGAAVSANAIAIKAKTDLIPASPAAVGSAMVLSASGLDLIPITAPSGPASNFREMVVQTWRRFFKKATKSSTQILTYADDETTLITTQAITTSVANESLGTAS